MIDKVVWPRRGAADYNSQRVHNTIVLQVSDRGPAYQPKARS